jgi:hypothetical protein
MITEAVVRLFAGLLTLIGNLMPNVNTPGFFDSVAGAVGTVAGFMAPLGNWVPFSAAVQGTTFVLACVAAALVVKLVRITVSLLTGGGGGAA